MCPKSAPPRARVARSERGRRKALHRNSKQNQQQCNGRKPMATLGRSNCAERIVCREVRSDNSLARIWSHNHPPSAAAGPAEEHRSPTTSRPVSRAGPLPNRSDRGDRNSQHVFAPPPTRSFPSEPLFRSSSAPRGSARPDCGGPNAAIVFFLFV